MPVVDVDGLGDLLVLAFVAVGALLVALTLVERWLTAQTAKTPQTPHASEATPTQETVVPPAASDAEPPMEGDGEV